MGRRVVVTGVLVLALALVGVAGVFTRGGSPGRRAGDGRLRVVAGFYPLAELAARVGGDDVEVTNLTGAGGEPHDLELTTDQVDRIEDAAVVLYLGDGFQPAVEAAARRARGRAVDLLAADLGVDVGGDPHVWLDVSLQRRMAEIAAAVLAEADPDRAAGYRSRAEAYAAELSALDDEFAAGLADCDRRLIVTSHDAFGHLARRYSLAQEAVAGLSPESEPEAQRLAELARQVRALGVTTVFSESQAAPEVAETLARESGATTAVLDPLESLSDDRLSGGEDYASVMRENLVALRSALGCR